MWMWSHRDPPLDDVVRLAPPTATRRRASAGGLYPRWLPFLPRTRTGAVAAKEIRYYLRDPRRRGPLFAAMIVPGLFLFETLRDAPSRPPASTMLALVALLPASGLTLNQFGLDGAALWSTVVAGSDPRADLTGKNIATAVIVVPLVAVPALITASITSGWAYLPITLGLAPGMLGRGTRDRQPRLGVGSVRAARPAQSARVEPGAGLRGRDRRAQRAGRRRARCSYRSGS